MGLWGAAPAPVEEPPSKSGFFAGLMGAETKRPSAAGGGQAARAKAPVYRSAAVADAAQAKKGVDQGKSTAAAAGASSTAAKGGGFFSGLLGSAEAPAPAASEDAEKATKGGFFSGLLGGTRAADVPPAEANSSGSYFSGLFSGDAGASAESAKSAKSPAKGAAATASAEGKRFSKHDLGLFGERSSEAVEDLRRFSGSWSRSPKQQTKEEEAAGLMERLTGRRSSSGASDASKSFVKHDLGLLGDRSSTEAQRPKPTPAESRKATKATKARDVAASDGSASAQPSLWQRSSSSLAALIPERESARVANDTTTAVKAQGTREIDLDPSGEEKAFVKHDLGLFGDRSSKGEGMRSSKSSEVATTAAEVQQRMDKVAKKKEEVAKQEEEVARQARELARKEVEMAKKEEEVALEEESLAKKARELMLKEDEAAAARDAEWAKEEEALLKLEADLARRRAELGKLKESVALSEEEKMQNKATEVAKMAEEVAKEEAELEKRKRDVSRKASEVAAKAKEVARKAENVAKKGEAVAKKDKELSRQGSGGFLSGLFRRSSSVEAKAEAAAAKAVQVASAAGIPPDAAELAGAAASKAIELGRGGRTGRGGGDGSKGCAAGRLLTDGCNDCKRGRSRRHCPRQDPQGGGQASRSRSQGGEGGVWSWRIS